MNTQGFLRAIQMLFDRFLTGDISDEYLRQEVGSLRDIYGPEIGVIAGLAGEVVTYFDLLEEYDTVSYSVVEEFQREINRTLGL